MKRIIIYLLFIICISKIANSQSYQKIESFTYHMATAKNGQYYYILKPCFRLLNNQLDCQIDSVSFDDPSIHNILSVRDTIYNNWFFETTCYHFQNLAYCFTDSVKLYIPIENKITNSQSNDPDYLNVVDLSSILTKANEPIIYGNIHHNNLIRLTAIYDYVEITRFESNKDSIIIYNNKSDYPPKEPTFTYKSVKLTDHRKYRKLLKVVNSLIILKSDNPEKITNISNFLLETYLDGKYCYLRTSDTELLDHAKRKYKKLLRLISKCLKP